VNDEPEKTGIENSLNNARWVFGADDETALPTQPEPPPVPEARSPAPETPSNPPKAKKKPPKARQNLPDADTVSTGVVALVIIVIIIGALVALAVINPSVVFSRPGYSAPDTATFDIFGDAAGAGSAPENLIAGGFAARQPGWTFYANPGDKFCLYVLEDGADIPVKLTDFAVANINILGDRLVFTDMTAAAVRTDSGDTWHFRDDAADSPKAADLIRLSAEGTAAFGGSLYEADASSLFREGAEPRVTRWASTPGVRRVYMSAALAGDGAIYCSVAAFADGASTPSEGSVGALRISVGAARFLPLYSRPDSLALLGGTLYAPCADGAITIPADTFSRASYFSLENFRVVRGTAFFLYEGALCRFDSDGDVARVADGVNVRDFTVTKNGDLVFSSDGGSRGMVTTRFIVNDELSSDGTLRVFTSPTEQMLKYSDARHDMSDGGQAFFICGDKIWRLDKTIQKWYTYARAGEGSYRFGAPDPEPPAALNQRLKGSDAGGVPLTFARMGGVSPEKIWD
jgi:hypothetical protein